MAKISTYPDVVPPALDDYVIGTDVSNLDATKSFVIADVLALVNKYKVYSALISCTNSSTVTVNVLENNIGSIVWSRNSAGNYSATLASAFTIGKTAAIVNVNNGYLVIALSTTNVSADVVFVQTNLSTTGAYVDYIEKLYVEIRVYN
jgi:hypothetical protein